MATSSRRSLVSRAGAAARKVVARKAAPAEKAVSGKKASGSTSPTKTAAKKAPAQKPTAKKSTAKKTTAKKVPASKAPAKKAPAKKATAKKTTAKKTTAKKTTAKKATASKAPAKKTPAKKAPATKGTARKTSTVKKTPAASAVASKPVTGRAEARRLVVREGEDPWTKDELAEVRAQLRADVKRLTAELEMVEEDLVGLMRSSGEGAGNDQADVGSATFERDQELTIANNARDMLVQSQHALDRIGNGSYGVCEVCGEPIGKNRLMVFPRATMCMSCKQREERR